MQQKLPLVHSKCDGGCLFWHHEGGLQIEFQLSVFSLLLKGPKSSSTRIYDVKKTEQLPNI
jgi:hypothetical protein